MKLTRIRETRMYAKALKQRWPISDEQKSEIVTALLKVVKDPNASKREVIAATQGLIAAEGQNQKDELIQNKDGSNRHEPNRFKELAGQLGILTNSN